MPIRASDTFLPLVEDYIAEILSNRKKRKRRTSHVLIYLHMRNTGFLIQKDMQAQLVIFWHEHIQQRDAGVTCTVLLASGLGVVRERCCHKQLLANESKGLREFYRKMQDKRRLAWINIINEYWLWLYFRQLLTISNVQARNITFLKRLQHWSCLLWYSMAGSHSPKK